MVYTEKEVQDLEFELVWVRNVPFSAAPKACIEQIPERSFNYEKYLGLCAWLDSMPNYWTLAAYDNSNQMQFFAWGTFDLLEGEMRVLRVSCIKQRQSVKGLIIKMGLEEVKRWAQEFGLQRVQWETHKWKSYERKLDGLAYTSEARVMLAY